MKVLSSKKDLYTLFCMGAFSFLMLAPFLKDVPFNYLPLWIVLSLHFSFCVNLINHNHAHVPTFRVALLNDLFDYWLTLLRGGSAVFIKIIHNINHHHYIGAQEDWFSPQNGSAPFTYVITTVKRFRAGAKSYYSKMGKEFLKKQKIERVLLIIFISTLVIISFKKFLLFILVPWLFGNFFLVYTNLIFHKGADPLDDYNNSYNFTNSIENALYFNGGYHTVHHLNSAIHWSMLPEKHAELVSKKIRPELMQKSMFVHAFKINLRD